MTPKATYAGSFEDKSLAWQIDELEVDIVENVTVNRGKKDGYVTGQDASMRLFDVMCPLSGEGEGQFNPVSYQEGEDGNLLVNKCILKCLVHKAPPPPPPPAPTSNRLVWTDGTYTDTDIEIFTGAETLDGYLTGIGRERDEIVECYVFEESVGYSVFVGMENLEKVYFDSQVTSFTSEMFRNDPKLEEVFFAGRTLLQVENLPYYSWGIEDTSVIKAELPPADPTLTRFYYEDGSVEEKDIVGSLIRSGFQSNGLTKVEVGTHVDTIGNSAFNGIATLQNVVLPTTLSAIESNAFLSCMGLSSINLPEGLKTTGDSCFKSCTSLTSIRIPSTVEHMGQQTFKSCTSLSSAYFEDGLSDVANQTFAYCSQLVDVRIPYTATRIGEQVFLRCTGLQTIRFDDSVVDTLDMNAFNGCTSLSAVYGPGSLTSLKFGVFLDCTSLKTFNRTGEVYLYDALEEMGSRVFSNSGVEKVSFPNWSAMGISNYAFTGCSTLTDVVVRGVTTHEAMSLENYPWGISN